MEQCRCRLARGREVALCKYPQADIRHICTSDAAEDFVLKTYSQPYLQLAHSPTDLCSHPLGLTCSWLRAQPHRIDDVPVIEQMLRCTDFFLPF